MEQSNIESGTMPGLLEKPLFIFALQALMLVIMLHACWSGPFYHVDDALLVSAAADKPLSATFRPYRAYNYIPVTELSAKLDYALFAPAETGEQAATRRADRKPFNVDQKWAAAMRVMNGVYHLIAGMLLWLFLRRLGASAGIAAVVAIAWTGHPMACESVCWIVERKNVLAGLFGFATLLAWTAPNEKWWRWPLVYGLFALALLSKSSALGILPVLFALEIIDPQKREFDFRKPAHWARSALRLAVPVVFAGAISAVTAYVFKGDIVEPLGGSLFATLLTDVEIFASYVQRILIPLNLSFYYYVQPIVSMLDARLWLYLIPMLGVLVFFIRICEPKQRPLVILGIVWFFGALGPNSNLVATAFPIQDRFSYISAAGLLLAAAVSINSLIKRHTDKGSIYVAAAYLVFFAVLLSFRSPIFRNSDTLEADAAKKQPQSAYAQLCVANRCRDWHIKFVEQAQREPATFFGVQALKHYERAEAAPDVGYFQNKLVLRIRQAEILVALGQFNEARARLEGWLPPKDMPMHPPLLPGAKHSRQARLEEFAGYYPATLAHGFVLSAEVNLQLSAARDLDVAARLALCQRALADAGKASEIHAGEYQAELVKLRALLTLHHLEQSRGKTEEAAKWLASAGEVVNGIPPSSPNAAVARQILASIKPKAPEAKAPAVPAPQPPPQ